jgi:hypothetical protein
MIASYKYGFIFVRTKKTASTAVELGLSMICGPDDVISPIGAGQEILRSQLGAAPRNFNADRTLERRLAEAVRTGKRAPVRELTALNRATGGCTGHMSAGAVKEWVAPDFWNSAYKFTTERHPYEKALSLAHFKFKGKIAKKVKFEDHLEETVKNDFRVYASYKIYSIDGKSVMDGFLLHDTLTADLAALRERLRLPTFELPRARGRRTDRRPALEVLNDSQKAFIYEKCKREFDLLGWKQ